jgi:hypothetical protein
LSRISEHDASDTAASQFAADVWRLKLRSERAWVLSAGQAQKEFYHNEALQTLDIIVAAAVEDGPIDAPPASPVVGACYLISSTPTDAWAANPLALAGYSSGGWRFVAPTEGLTAYVKSQGLRACFRAGAWELGLLRGSSVVIGDQQVVGGRAAAIPSATGGTVVDTEARAAIDLVLGALRQHGLIES